jgi:RNA polymerase sigma factor (sigma-70 family)
MSRDTLDHLLERLCSGDESSAERVFLDYEPYLRLVVRRMLSPRLRSKFDSVDVVQSVWADVVVGFREAGWRFETTAQLKAFLVKATRNRFLDRVRQQRLPMACERSLEVSDLNRASSSNDTEPGGGAEADELWQQMLALCPPQHQPLLELKRQGCSLATIAERTGFHPSSVRRIFYDLARRLAVAAE